MLRVRIARILQKNPVLIISKTETLPVPKAMAFGGVAAGSMNERMQASALNFI